jgi:chromosome segregation ATPase
METGDLVAYEFVTPNGEWSWSIGTVEDCSRTCLVDISQWTDSSSGRLHGKDATEYFESLRDAEESDQAAKRLVDEVRAMRMQIMQQRAEAEENERRARERLLAAQEDVRQINAGDIREMRSYRTPPTLVKETLAAVLCLLRQSPVPETWENVQRVIRNQNFINNVINLDPNNEDTDLNRSVMSHYLSNPAMTVENVNLASKAAGPLLKWLFAKIGATSATVELRAFDKEVHTASMQLKRKSERIAILQQKAVASQKRAAELRDSAMQSNLSFRKVPGQGGPLLAQQNVWSKDTSDASRLTILTTSILCNFGVEQCDKRILSADEQNMISEAHQTARRDNSDRLNFALESLATREKEVQQLQEKLVALEARHGSLEASFAEEKHRADRYVQIANDEAAASERIQSAYREEAALSKSSQQRVRTLEQACRDLQTQLDTATETLQQETSTIAKERSSLQDENEHIQAALLEAVAAHNDLQHAYDVLQENLATLKEVNAEEIRSLELERDAATIESATYQHHLETERETSKQLRSSIEQDHAGYMDDIVRRETAWLSMQKQLEGEIQSLRRRVDELQGQQEQTSRSIEQSTSEYQQTSQELLERLRDQSHTLEDTQAALSLAEAQNIRLAEDIEEQQKQHVREVERLSTAVEELEAAREDLETRLADEERSAAEASKTKSVLQERLEEAHAAFQSELEAAHTAHASAEASHHEQCSELVVALRAAQAELDASAAREADLVSKCAELSNALQATELQLAVAKREHSTSSEEQHATQRRLSTVGSELEMKQADLERVSCELDRVSKTLEALTARHEELLQNHDDQSHEVETTKEVFQTTASELDRTRALLADSDERLNSTTEMLKERESDLAIAHDTIKQSNDAYNSASTSLATMKDALEALQSEHDAQCQSLAEEQRAHKSAQEELHSVTASLHERTEEVRRVSQELQLVRDTQGATSSDLQSALADRDDLTARLIHLTEELSSAEKQNRDTTAAIDSLQGQLAETTDELQRVQKMREQLMEDLHQTTDELESLQEAHDATTKHLSTVSSERQQKHSDLEEKTATLQQLRDQQSVTEEALATVTAALHERSAELAETTATLETLRGTHERQKKDLTEALAELDIKRSALETSNAQLTSLKELHDATTARATELQAAYDLASKELQRSTEDLAATKQSLHNTSDENTKELVRLRSDLYHKGESIEVLRQEVEQSRVREQQMNTRHDMIVAEKGLVLREMEAQGERNRIECAALQAQIDALRSAALQKETIDSEAETRNAADRSRELEDMQSRLERELQYMQSVHASIVAQHVQLEHELRTHVEGLMKENEQQRGQLRACEDRNNETQQRLDDARESARGSGIRLAAADEQITKLLAAVQTSEQHCSDLEHQMTLLTEALDRAEDNAAELAAQSENQQKAIAVLDGAQEAAEAMDEERRADLEALTFERDELVDRLHAANIAREAQEALHEKRVQDEQQCQRELQRDIDALSEKLMECNRLRVQSSSEHTQAMERVQQEKREAVEDLNRQLESSHESEEEARRAVRLLTMERDTLTLATQHKDGEIAQLQSVRQHEANDRQQRLEELVTLHRDQLSALRKERDAVIRELHSEELNRSDMEFQLAEARSRLARYETVNEDGTSVVGTLSLEQRQMDELRSRLNALQREMDKDSQLLREKDNQLRDMSRRVVEYELLTAEQDQKRTEAAVALRERELVLERERLLRNDRDKAHRAEMEELQRRVVTLEVAGSDVETTRSGQSKGAPRRKSIEVVAPPQSKPRESPPPLNPAALHRHNNAWQPVGHNNNTPSVATSNSRKDPNADLVTGAHLVVMIRKVADLQVNGKPFKATEVYAKLKTIKEKHRSTYKPLCNFGADFDEQFVFHLAQPSHDVVHISIVARSPGSLFDNEVSIGDVDLSMATLSKGVPRTRTYTIVQDARTKKARPSGFIEIVLRTDDFGAATTPSAVTVASEEMRYQAMFQTALTEHAIEVYMAGEGAAIEEASKKVR